MKMNSMYVEVGLAVCLGCSIAYSICLGTKLKKVAASVNLTVDELSTKSHIDIADSMIDSAVQNAVNREIQDVIRITNRRLAEEIRQQVKDSVDISYSELKGSVANEIAGQVRNIDMRKIEKEAITKAKETIVDKFDGKLDDLLEEFNGKLKSISKIYDSIAKTMSEKI